jgi:sporulation protein YlmC with PRC-barrel domain
MRKVLLAILTGSTALGSTVALAQAPQSGGATATAPAVGTTATLADCDRLLTLLEQRRPANPGLTVEQVRSYRGTNNAQACHDTLVRIDPTAALATGKEGEGTSVVVQQPAPAVRVDQAAPQVTVQQPQPQVTVRQPQPEITVRQPAPTVTIDIPQPEIIVRMPRPQVDVAMAQPQVQVNQPPPQVQVTQPQQPQVDVQPAEPRVNVQTGAAATVQVEENKTQPTVRYERAEPKVVINQAQGEPQVKLEPAEGPNSSQPATTGAAPRQGVTVARIKSMDLFNMRGDRLGDVERVIQSVDGKRHIVVGIGGFLGIGERHVAIPAERVVVRGNRLVIDGLTDDQVKRMPPFDRNNRDFREVEANATLEISG